MKKFLSLVLALVMTMSLVTVAGAKDITDADSVNYDEAVDVLYALEIVGGYADGSFGPEKTLTRGAASKIICNILVGPEAAESLVASEAPYADVPADSVYAGYIAYCANAGLVSGYADGTFRPYAQLTGYAFMKMLLTAIGYDQTIEGYTGTNWAINVAQDVAKLELAKGLDGKFNGNKVATREEAALYALNAMNAYTATYDNKGSNIQIGDIQINTGADKVDVSTTELLRHIAFKDTLTLNNKTADSATGTTDALNRPAHTWYLDGEEIGTYADEADYVISGEIDADDWKNLVEELDVTFPSALTAASTANGKDIELFYNKAGDAVSTWIPVEAKLSTTKITVLKDLVSSKEDDRALKIDGMWVVADKDADRFDASAYANKVELDNFEALWDAVDEDEDLKVLYIKDKSNKLFSVEIPEVVEAKVTSVKKDTIVAGGESYTLAGRTGAYPSVSVGDDQLWVGENGYVYFAKASDPDVSDVIYLDIKLTPDNDKYGNPTYKAQIVNEDNEIVDIVLAATGHDMKDDAVADEVYADLTEKTFYTYEINDDDEYELTKVPAKTATGAMDEDKSYVTIDSKKAYFAEDMEVVFIDKSGKKLAVTVKEGVQDGYTGAHYVLNDDKEVAIVYVLAAYEEATTDVLFVTDFTADGSAADLEGTSRATYEVYKDGAKIDVMIGNVGTGTGKVNTAGFYNYDIDADTGVYTLTAKAGYVNVVVVKDQTITKDAYVSVADPDAAGVLTALDDAVVGGEIYDTTEEGLYTLADIAAWDSATDKATISFLYDTDAEEISVLYVTFTTVTPAP